MTNIYQIEGGTGKSVVATAVCKAIKAHYREDELVVITAYPEVFISYPGLKVYNFNDMRYFYDQYIDDKEFRLMLHDPYRSTSFVKGKTHLINVWTDLFGVTYNGEKPDVFLTDREYYFYFNQFRTEKPLMVVQSSGGAQNQQHKYSWYRDLPQAVAQKVVNAFAKDYHIIHFRRDDQLPLNNTTQVPTSIGFRGMAALIAMSEKRLFIDSFAQHTAAALGKPSVVCMINETVLNQFGYDLHHNIIANTPTVNRELRYSVFSKYNIAGDPTEFPYKSELLIYDADQIIEAVRKDMNIIENGVPDSEKRKEIQESLVA